MVATRKILIFGSVIGWVVPEDWNNASNTIECIGGGGGGISQSVSGGLAGGGGGGGAYSLKNNVSLTPGATVALQIGTGGAAGVTTPGTGGDTWFNGASLAASSCGAKGGSPANGTTSGAGGVGTSGIGDTRNSGGAGDRKSVV